MFTRVRHFLGSWSHESDQTGRMLAAITDAALPTRAAEGHRTLGDLAWHIVVAPRTILGKIGLTFAAPERGSPTPARAEEIHDQHSRAAHALAGVVESAWSDEILREKVEFYGTLLPRGAALAVMLHHEIHHRGQLTVLMRLAGLPVPGVYGPSKDDER